MESKISVNLEKTSKAFNTLIPLLALAAGLFGHFVSFYFHFLTVTLILMTLINFFYRHVQTRHALLRNFGMIAQMRYILESLGPEFRQYLYSSDTEEKPFSRVERSEVYRKAKGVDSSSAFGSQLLFNDSEIKLRHSMYPLSAKEIVDYNLVVGEERNLKKAYTLTKPILISAMSYGALGERAVRALARGAKRANIVMNTGEGGFPKYHLMEGCDLIFQMGTAKFGVRNENGSLNKDKLQDLCRRESVKMVEIKFSQGAKPGKGGLLPKEKITKEISELRGVPMGKDVISPSCHMECHDAKSTVSFIAHVQEIAQLPVGIKMCLGRESEFKGLLEEMKRQNALPDYITIDGAEGGTGAAPKSFMDDLGVPLFRALPKVNTLLKEAGLRHRLKLFCGGKLISAGKQFIAFSLGAQATYTARGFMLSLGCIQALQCNNNSCPVGITTHQWHLQKGLNIEVKSKRVENYIYSLLHDHQELLASMGKKSVLDLNENHIYWRQSGYSQSGYRQSS